MRVVNSRLATTQYCQIPQWEPGESTECGLLFYLGRQNGVKGRFSEFRPFAFRQFALHQRD